LTSARYIRDKRARLLIECADKIEQFEQDIKDLVTNIENTRDAIAKIDREISESGSLMANLHGNIRIRKLSRDIAATQAEIDSCDMEGAAKAKRNFEDRYQVEKQRETEMQSKVRARSLSLFSAHPLCFAVCPYRRRNKFPPRATQDDREGPA
jgi:DNA repair protein RAD50